MWCHVNHVAAEATAAAAAAAAQVIYRVSLLSAASSLPSLSSFLRRSVLLLHLSSLWTWFHLLGVFSFSLSLSVHPRLSNKLFPISSSVPLPFSPLAPLPHLSSPLLHLCHADGEAAGGDKTVQSSVIPLTAAFKRKRKEKKRNFNKTVLEASLNAQHLK